MPETDDKPTENSKKAVAVSFLRVGDWFRCCPSPPPGHSAHNVLR